MPRTLPGLVAALLMSGTAALGALRAGVAKAAITPDVKAARVEMAGFGNGRVAAGVHDDLYVRCLALGAGRQTVVLCAADLIGLFYDDVLKAREEVKTRAPEATLVIVASTHDHEGPDTLGLWGPSPLESGINDEYMKWLDDRIARTAASAVHHMQNARLMLARDDEPSLALLQDDSRPPYVKDPYLFVMQLVSQETGQPIATLVNWSDHPETLGGKNTEITADYPYWLCRYVEEHGGGTAVFFNGAIGGLLSTVGNQVAVLDLETGKVAQDGTWAKAQLFGTMIGELAMHALQSAKEWSADGWRIRRKVIFAPLDNDRFRIAGAMGIFKGRKQLYTDGRADTGVAERNFPPLGNVNYSTGRDLRSEVDYLELLEGPSPVAEIAAVPGEIYPELVNGGIARYPGADYPDAPFEPALRPHFRTKYEFIFGLANDELGYMIPKAEWDNRPPWLLGKKDRWYGEMNSAGEEVAGVVTRALVELMEEK